MIGSMPGLCGEVAPYIATLPLPPDYIQQELGMLNIQMDYDEDSRLFS